MTTKTETPLWLTCGKCVGTGVVTWGNVHWVQGKDDQDERWCFDCNGDGGKWTTEEREERNRKARERYAAKKEAEAQARLAEAEATRLAFLAANPGLEAALEAAPGGFGESVRADFEAEGTLTDNQVAAVLRIAAEKAAEPEVTEVPEGRYEVTGKIATVRTQDGFYGVEIKMLVLDDRGFKVWGTMPQALYEAERGDRVTFTATVTRKDHGFGIAARPTKARMLEEGE